MTIGFFVNVAIVDLLSVTSTLLISKQMFVIFLGFSHQPLILVRTLGIFCFLFYDIYDIFFPDIALSSFNKYFIKLR